MSKKEEKQDLGTETLLDDNVQGFKLNNLLGNGSVEVLAEKDEKGDYPVIMFNYTDAEGKEVQFALPRDEMAAITFILARQDQQDKLLQHRFLTYKEVPVRLMIEAKKDIKKGDFVVCWRKERVPQDYEYTKI